MTDKLRTTSAEQAPQTTCEEMPQQKPLAETLQSQRAAEHEPTPQPSRDSLASAADSPDARIATINRLLKEYDSLYRAVAARLGVSDSISDALYTLYLHDGATQKDICDNSYVSKQTIHSAVMRLQRDGLVRAERGHGRTVKLFLTETGRAEAARVAKPVIEAEKRAYDELSPREFDQLLAFLTRIGGRLRCEMDAIGADGRKPQRRSGEKGKA